MPPNWSWSLKTSDNILENILPGQCHPYMGIGYIHNFYESIFNFKSWDTLSVLFTCWSMWWGAMKKVYVLCAVYAWACNVSSICSTKCFVKANTKERQILKKGPAKKKSPCDNISINYHQMSTRFVKANTKERPRKKEESLLKLSKIAPLSST